MCYFKIFIFYRTLENGTSTALTEKDRMLQEKEAELKRMQEMLAAMQAQIQQQQ